MTGVNRITKVFISYTHDSQPHKDLVLDLSNQMRGDGIDSHIDQYETSPLEGWPQWMQNQIEDADFVLVVCTETYLRRFSGKEETGKGKGGTWEGGIITRAMYESQGRNSKFIPVCFSEDDLRFIPGILQGATHYVAGTEEGYISLLRHVTNKPAIIKPELGKSRALPPLERRQNFERASAERTVQVPEGSSTKVKDGSIRILLNTDEGKSEIVSAERVESGPTLKLFLLPADPREVSFLTDLRRRNRGFIGVAYQNQGMHATVISISSSMQGSKDLWTVELKPFDGDYRGTGLGEMSCGNYSADEIAEMRARRLLLDEKVPGMKNSPDDTMLEVFVRGIGTRIKVPRSLIPDIFAAAKGNIDDFLEAARLFSVLFLHVSGVVEHIYELEMEMAGESELAVKFEGRRPRTYVNVDPTGINIEGTCKLRR